MIGPAALERRFASVVFSLCPACPTARLQRSLAPSACRKEAKVAVEHAFSRP